MPESQSPSDKAFYLPFLAFITLMMLGEAAGALSKSSSWFFRDPQYWVKPAQTLISGALLIFYWRQYDFGLKSAPTKKWLIGTGVGLLAFILWISPQLFLGSALRLKGFDPNFFGGEGTIHGLNLAFRFLRLVVVVPLIEEIFWRGYLLRWLVKEKFAAVPFGTFSMKAFLLVAVFFMFEHAPTDYPAAFLTGLLYNAVAVQTRSLGACVAAHAVTNLALGVYLMRTQQWGFW